MCEAVSTIPASARSERVMYATPGVGNGPISNTSTPMDKMPAEIAFSNM